MWMKFVAIFMCALIAIIVLPSAHFFNIVHADPTGDGEGYGGPDTPSKPPATTSKTNTAGDLGTLAATATAAAVVSAFAFTLPGTTQVGDWTDPRTKTPPPPPGNPYLCSAPGNYTLDAQLDAENAITFNVQPLFQSGDQITVFGDVSAKSSTCKGLNLTDRK